MRVEDPFLLSKFLGLLFVLVLIALPVNAMGNPLTADQVEKLLQETTSQ